MMSTFSSIFLISVLGSTSALAQSSTPLTGKWLIQPSSCIRSGTSGGFAIFTDRKNYSNDDLTGFFVLKNLIQKDQPIEVDLVQDGYRSVTFSNVFQMDPATLTYTMPLKVYPQTSTSEADTSSGSTSGFFWGPKGQLISKGDYDHSRNWQDRLQMGYRVLSFHGTESIAPTNEPNELLASLAVSYVVPKTSNPADSRMVTQTAKIQCRMLRH